MAEKEVNLKKLPGKKKPPTLTLKIAFEQKPSAKKRGKKAAVKKKKN